MTKRRVSGETAAPAPSIDYEDRPQSGSESVIQKPARSRFARLHPKGYLSAHALVGLGIAIVCTWLFSAIAGEIPERDTLLRVDLSVAQWLQAHGTETGESVFAYLSLLGAPVVVALLVVAAIAFAVREDWRRLVIVAVTGGGGALLNVALKVSFHRARPTFASEFYETSWSFPSGHAMNSLIAYGLLAYWLGVRFPRARVAIMSTAAAVIAVIGFARIYLGVHYLSDVVAGYMAGFIWLTVCITGAQFAERRRIGAPKLARDVITSPTPSARRDTDFDARRLAEQP